MHLSSTKLSNLLKSQSSSVSADETRPPLKSDDPYIGLKKSRFARSINNADRQTSRALAWCQKTCISRDDHFYKCGCRVCVHGWLRLILLFVLFSMCTRFLFFFFYRLSLQHACDEDYLIINDICNQTYRVSAIKSKKVANTCVIYKIYQFQRIVFFKRYV